MSRFGFVIVVDFPDEVSGIDHMHRRFYDDTEADEWLDFLDVYFGPIDKAYFYDPYPKWVCPRCHRLA